MTLRGSDTLGGTTPAARNVISGSTTGGVLVEADPGEPLGRVLIEGNFIGTDASGTIAIGNRGPGIVIPDVLPDAVTPAPQTTSGVVTIAGNVIDDNAGDGVLIGGNPGAVPDGPRGPAAQVTLTGNTIGTANAGTAVLGNLGDGIDIASAVTPVTIGGTGPGQGNTIAHNHGFGVAQRLGDAPILASAIFGNAVVGPAGSPQIVSPSYARFAAPELTAAIGQGGDVTIFGTFAAGPNQPRTFAFFASPTSSAASPGGQLYLGAASAMSDVTGRGYIRITFPAPGAGLDLFTATAIYPSAGPAGSGATSAFSNGVIPAGVSGPLADLVVAGYGPEEQISPKSVATFTFTVTNDGASSAYGVTLNELFPDGGPLLSATTSRGSITFTPDGNFVGKLGTLAPGAVASITIRTGFSGVAEGGYLAETLVTALTPDVVPRDDVLVVSVPVEPAGPTPATVALALSATTTPKSVPAGSRVTYVLTATNDGPTNAGDAALFYSLPDNATLVSAVSSQGRVVTDTPSSGGLVTAYFGTILDMTAPTLTIVVDVAAHPSSKALISRGILRSDNPEVDVDDNLVDEYVTIE